LVPLNDVLVDGKKVSGNAQTRKKVFCCSMGQFCWMLTLKWCLACWIYQSKRFRTSWLTM